MANTETSKHCDNLLKVRSEIKQYVKNTTVKSLNDLILNLINENCNKITKIKTKVVVTTYR